MHINYRILPPDEWDKLSGLLDPKYIPAVEAATASVAEDENGKIVGVCFLQLQLHMEPLVIHDPHVNFRRLIETLHNAVSEHEGLTYFAFTADPKVARMAEMAGFTPMSVGVWKREVT